MVARIPGSREEDAWLSDEQLEKCAPAETEPFIAPVPTRMISNGEYMPHPQTEQQKHVEHRVKELADYASKKLGVTRRQFLEGSGGMAASFIAMNEVFGKPFFKVSKDELFEPEAHDEDGPPKDLFVFDDQTHIVRSSSNGAQGLRALAQGPGPVSTAAGFTGNPDNGFTATGTKGGNPVGVDELGNAWTPWNPTQLHPDFPPNPGPPTTVAGEFHLGQYINRMYLEAQTSVSIISNANLGLFNPGGGAPPGNHNIAESLQAEILTGWQTGQCRNFINGLAGSTRALAHGQLYVGIGNLADPLFGDYTQWQIENMQPDSWKGYNVASAAKLDTDPNSLMVRWRLDDETVAYPIYQIITKNKDQLKKHPGFFNICIHKGLSASGTQPGGPNNMPQFGNPDDLVKACSDWPQFNFIIYHACIRPGFWMLQALQDIENQPGAMPPTTLTDSDGHTVPNVRWTTQMAQIAAGKYVAGAEPFSTSPSSHRRLPNLYAELGTTMASMIVTFPTVWAHLIGQLLYYMGEDNIVFGSDSMWYGGPQWQIEALWRSQIPDEIADRWRYPQLTKAAKRKILGLNSARLYGLAPAASRYKQGNLASYPMDPKLQPGGSMDAVLHGVGYPANITPASLIPDDNFARAKRWAEQERRGRSNMRFGFMRTRV